MATEQKMFKGILCDVYYSEKGTPRYIPKKKNNDDIKELSKLLYQNGLITEKIYEQLKNG